jgi:hypothetical protein
VVGSKPLT